MPLDPSPNSAAYIRTEPPHWCMIQVWHSEDFYEAVPQLIDGATGEPLNLETFADLQFNLWIRSEYASVAPTIDLLTTGDDGIYFDDRSQGLISFYRDRGEVKNYPIGTWVQWLNMLWTEPGGMAVTKTLWRGPLIVRPGSNQELVG